MFIEMIIAFTLINKVIIAFGLDGGRTVSTDSVLRKTRSGALVNDLVSRGPLNPVPLISIH